jgi:hypothetical protein
MAAPKKNASIHVRVEQMQQLFNSMDPSPFRQRDLDPDCEAFILGWARELPADHELLLEIQLASADPAEIDRHPIEPAIHAHFAREAGVQGQQLRARLGETRRNLLIGIVALTACLAGATYLPPAGAVPAFTTTLKESLVIAGWVAMWHPLESLLYGLWPVVRERRLRERLARAHIKVTAMAGAA